MPKLIVPTLKIKTSGTRIPVLGFGTGTQWRIAKREGDTKGQFINRLVAQLKEAINVGFTHIDTAEYYCTHEEVGAALKESNVPRNKLFITDKYNQGAWTGLDCSGPVQAAHKALKLLNLQYFDLYMLHRPDITKENAGIDLQEAWRQLKQLYESGLAKAIGVSNFPLEYLKKMESFCKYMPMVHQIEFNPYLQNQTPGVVEWCQKKDIVVEAYSPLTPLSRARPGPLDAILPGLVEKYRKSETQILLRWVIDRGLVVLTTSSKSERLQEILGSLEFELEKRDIDLISEVGREKHYQWCLSEFFAQFRS
ncbi:related to ketoreductase [Zygosaccharomyces bailii]|nr:related to ketoreductase [Zygosaccharomyces bailii]